MSFQNGLSCPRCTSYPLGNHSREIIYFQIIPAKVLGLALIGLAWSHANP